MRLTTVDELHQGALRLALVDERLHVGRQAVTAMDLAVAGAEERDSLDLDEEVGTGKRCDLYQRGYREITGEELAPRLPDLFAPLDVRDEDVHLHDIVHC